MNTVVIRVSGSYNANQILSQITAVESAGGILELIISNVIDKSIIWASSYSQENTLIIEIDMSLGISAYEWVGGITRLAQRCGLYFVLRFKNAIKEVDVLKVLESVMPCHYCSVVLEDCYEEFIEVINFYISAYGIEATN